MKVLLTGKQNGQEIISKFSSTGYDLEYLPMEEPLKSHESNFTFSNLKSSITYAQKGGHQLVIAIDEAGSKLGVAVRKSHEGPFQMLTVHQLAAVLAKLWAEENKGKPLVFVKSIHISEMVDKIALNNDARVESFIIENNLSEKVKTVLEKNDTARVFGFSENQDFVDSQVSIFAIVEKIIALEEKANSQKETLFDAVLALYLDYGFYKEKTFIVDLFEQSQTDHVRNQMDLLRKNQPIVKERLAIDRIIDFKKGVSINLQTNKKLSLNHPSADVLVIEMSDGTSVSLVPEKTKMSYHISMAGRLITKDNFAELNKSFDAQIFKLMEVLNKL